MPRGIWERTDEYKKKLSDIHKKNPNRYWLGKKRSKDTIDKMKSKLTGRKLSEEQVEGLRKRMTGSGNHAWKGGITIYERKLWLNRRRKASKRGNGGNHTLGEWEILKAQYNWTCPCCKRNETEVNLTEDHIVPLSKGGSDNIENIQPLCVSCNSKKHTTIILYTI